MNAIFIATLLFSHILVTFAYYQHKISPERTSVNNKIKGKFRQIRISATIAGHDNNSETVDDILKVVGQNVKDLPTNLLLLEQSNAVRAGFVDGLPEKPHNAPNPLLKSLPASGQRGVLSAKEAESVYELLGEVAAAYRDTFKADYGLAKQIYVIPFGKVNNQPKLSIVVAVMREFKGEISGLAGLLVDLDQINDGK